jgi:elongation factor P
LIFPLFSDNSPFHQTVFIPPLFNLQIETIEEVTMAPAADLKTGMILQMEKDLYTVLATEYHMGGGKMGGFVDVKLKGLRSGVLLERRFKPDDKLDTVELDRKIMEFLYGDADGYTMMDPNSYEQIQLSRSLLETFAPFPQPNMRLPVEFLEGEPVNVLFPEWAELEVLLIPPSISILQDEVYKPATLSNGMQVRVPQLIKVGDVVKVGVASKKYVERARR